LILLILTLLFGFPQENALQKAQKLTLQGLHGVQVLVEQISPEMESDGLTRNQIQTDVELRLRKAGISVLTDKQSMAAPGAPYLYINVQSLKTKASSACQGYVYNLEVSLHQDVKIDRAVIPTLPDYRYQASGVSTWRRALIGIVPINQIAVIRGDIADLVDQFMNDYLAANSK